MNPNTLVPVKTTWPDVLATILAANLADSTKRKYCRAVEGYLAAGGSLTDAEALATYAAGLPTSTRAFLKAAFKLWTKKMVTTFKGQATPDNLAAVQAAIYRLEALQEAIQLKTAKGEKAHTWLSQAEVRKLLATCGPDLWGRRDRLVLALFLGAGLRRQELITLTVDHVLLQPLAGKFRTVLNVTGKGVKNRVVPISDTLANVIDRWEHRIGNTGYLARAISPDRAIQDRLSSVAAFEIVRKAGERMGKPGLAPHDLRRTYAQLGYEAGVPITQISTLLGHASVATTQRYLNLELNLETTVSDFIPLD